MTWLTTHPWPWVPSSISWGSVRHTLSTGRCIQKMPSAHPSHRTRSTSPIRLLPVGYNHPLVQGRLQSQSPPAGASESCLPIALPPSWLLSSSAGVRWARRPSFMVHATVPEAPRSLPVSSFPASWELPRSWAHLIRFGLALPTSQSVPRKYNSAFGTTIKLPDAPLRTWRDKIATEICRQPF